MRNIQRAILPNISIFHVKDKNIGYQFFKVLDCVPVV